MMSQETIPRSEHAVEKLDEKATSKFLDLPPELRNRIYYFAMPLGKRHIIASHEWGGSYFKHPKPPSLTRTCRQVRQEALPVWRSENKFVIQHMREDTGTALAEWLKRADGYSGLEHMHLVLKYGGHSKCFVSDYDDNDYWARACCMVLRVRVELIKQKYAICVTRGMKHEKCKEFAEEAVETAFAYGEAKGWILAMGMVIGREFLEADCGLQVRYREEFDEGKYGDIVDGDKEDEEDEGER